MAENRFYDLQLACASEELLDENFILQASTSFIKPTESKKSSINSFLLPTDFESCYQEDFGSLFESPTNTSDELATMNALTLDEASSMKDEDEDVIRTKYKTLAAGLSSDVSFFAKKSVADRDLHRERQGFVMKNILEAFSFHTKRARVRENTKKDLSRSKLAKSRAVNPFPVSASMGIKATVRILLLLIQNARNGMVGQVLEVFSDVLGDFPPLTLVEGQEFHPSLNKALLPLMNFIQSILIKDQIGENIISDEDRIMSITVLFQIAMARGSLSNLLTLVTSLLKLDNIKYMKAYDVLKTLIEFALLDSSSIKETKNDENNKLEERKELNEIKDSIKLFDINTMNSDTNIELEMICVIIMSQLACLSNRSFGGQVLFDPLRIDLKKSTLEGLLAILDITVPMFSQGNNNNNSNNELLNKKYDMHMSILLDALFILRAHACQHSLSNLSLNEVGITSELVGRIYKHVCVLCGENKPKGTSIFHNHIIEMAGSVIDHSLNFFFESIHLKVEAYIDLSKNHSISRLWVLIIKYFQEIHVGQELLHYYLNSKLESNQFNNIHAFIDALIIESEKVTISSLDQLLIKTNMESMTSDVLVTLQKHIFSYERTKDNAERMDKIILKYSMNLIAACNRIILKVKDIIIKSPQHILLIDNILRNSIVGKVFFSFLILPNISSFNATQSMLSDFNSIMCSLVEIKKPQMNIKEIEITHNIECKPFEGIDDPSEYWKMVNLPKCAITSEHEHPMIESKTKNWYCDVKGCDNTSKHDSMGYQCTNLCNFYLCRSCIAKHALQKPYFSRLKHICISGAESLSITFDSNNTNVGGGYITLYRDAECKHPLSSDMSTFEQTYEVLNDHVYIYFTAPVPLTKEDGQSYGFKVSVEGIAKPSIGSWINELVTLVATQSGAMACSLIRGNQLLPVEEKLLLLEDEKLCLFGGGFRNNNNNKSTSSNIITNTIEEKKKINLIVDNIDELLPIEKSFMNEMLKEELNIDEKVYKFVEKLNILAPDNIKVRLKSLLKRALNLKRYVFLVLILHTGQLSTASICCRDEEENIPEQILMLWKESCFVKRVLEISKGKGKDKECYTEIVERVKFLCSLNEALHDDDSNNDTMAENMSLMRSFSDMPLKANTSSVMPLPEDDDEDEELLSLKRSFSEMPSFSSPTTSPARKLNMRTPKSINTTTSWSKANIMDKSAGKSLRNLSKLKTLIKAQRQRTILLSKSNGGGLVREIISFIGGNATFANEIDELKLALISQQERGEMRWSGLHFFHLIIKNISDINLLVDIIRPLSVVLGCDNSIDRSSSSSENNNNNNNNNMSLSHFLSNLNGASQHMKDSIADKYFSVTSDLLLVISNNESISSNQRKKQSISSPVVKSLLHISADENKDIVSVNCIEEKFEVKEQELCKIVKCEEGENTLRLITENAFARVMDFRKDSIEKKTSYILVGPVIDSETNIFDLNKSFSIELSVCVDSFEDTGMTILSNQNDSNEGWELILTSAGPQFSCTVQSGESKRTAITCLTPPTDKTSKTIKPVSLYPIIELEAHAWYRIAVDYDGYRMRAYVNGICCGSEFVASNEIINSNNKILCIGNSSAKHHCHCVIGDIHISNNILSSCTITSCPRISTVGSITCDMHRLHHKTSYDALRLLTFSICAIDKIESNYVSHFNKSGLVNYLAKVVKFPDTDTLNICSDEELKSKCLISTVSPIDSHTRYSAWALFRMITYVLRGAHMDLEYILNPIYNQLDLVWKVRERLAHVSSIKNEKSESEKDNKNTLGKRVKIVDTISAEDGHYGTLDRNNSIFLVTCKIPEGFCMLRSLTWRIKALSELKYYMKVRKWQDSANSWVEPTLYSSPLLVAPRTSHLETYSHEFSMPVKLTPGEMYGFYLHRQEGQAETGKCPSEFLAHSKSVYAKAEIPSAIFATLGGGDLCFTAKFGNQAELSATVANPHLLRAPVAWHVLLAKIGENLSVAETELFCNQLLWVSLRCVSTRELTQTLAQYKWLRLLFDISSKASSSVSRVLALRLLSLILRNLSPSNSIFNALSLSLSSDEAKGIERKELGGRGVLLPLLQQTGERAFPWKTCLSSINNISTNRSSDVSIRENISIFRVLLSVPTWSSAVNQIILAGMKLMNNVSKKLGDLSLCLMEDSKRIDNVRFGQISLSINASSHIDMIISDMQRIFASLSVLGGNHEEIAEASTVRVTLDGESHFGTVVFVENNDTDFCVRVSLEDGEEVEYKNPDDLVLVCHPPLSLSLLTIQNEILQLIVQFLKSPEPILFSDGQLMQNHPRLAALHVAYVDLCGRSLGVILSLLNVEDLTDLTEFGQKGYGHILAKALFSPSIVTSGENIPSYLPKHMHVKQILAQRLLKLRSAWVDSLGKEIGDNRQDEFPLSTTTDDIVSASFANDVSAIVESNDESTIVMEGKHTSSPFDDESFQFMDEKETATFDSKIIENSSLLLKSSSSSSSKKNNKDIIPASLVPFPEAAFLVGSPAHFFHKIEQEVKEDTNSFWSCAACTYINAANRSRCEICDSTKPPAVLKGQEHVCVNFANLSDTSSKGNASIMGGEFALEPTLNGLLMKEKQSGITYNVPNDILSSTNTIAVQFLIDRAAKGVVEDAKIQRLFKCSLQNNSLSSNNFEYEFGIRMNENGLADMNEQGKAVFQLTTIDINGKQNIQTCEHSVFHARTRVPREFFLRNKRTNQYLVYSGGWRLQDDPSPLLARYNVDDGMNDLHIRAKKIGMYARCVSHKLKSAPSMDPSSRFTLNSEKGEYISFVNSGNLLRVNNDDKIVVGPGAIDSGALWKIVSDIPRDPIVRIYSIEKKQYITREGRSNAIFQNALDVSRSGQVFSIETFSDNNVSIRCLNGPLGHPYVTIDIHGEINLRSRSHSKERFRLLKLENDTVAFLHMGTPNYFLGISLESNELISYSQEEDPLPPPQCQFKLKPLYKQDFNAASVIIDSKKENMNILINEKLLFTLTKEQLNGFNFNINDMKINVGHNFGGTLKHFAYWNYALSLQQCGSFGQTGLDYLIDFKKKRNEKIKSYVFHPDMKESSYISKVSIDNNNNNIIIPYIPKTIVNNDNKLNDNNNELIDYIQLNHSNGEYIKLDTCLSSRMITQCESSLFCDFMIPNLSTLPSNKVMPIIQLDADNKNSTSVVFVDSKGIIGFGGGVLMKKPIIEETKKIPQKVAISVGNTIQIHSLDDGKLEKEFTGTSVIRTLCLMPDHETLLSGSEDGSLNVWNIHTGNCDQKISHTAILTNIRMTIDEQHIIITVASDILILSATTFTVKQTLSGHSGAIWGLDILPNGNIVSGSYDDTAKVWDLQTGSCICTFTEHTDDVNAVLALPYNRVASGSDDKTIKIWDAETAECYLSLSGHTGFVMSLSLLPDGRIISGSRDQSIRIWNTTNGDEEVNLTGHTSAIKNVCVLPSGKFVSTANDCSWCLWESNEDNTYSCSLNIAVDQTSIAVCLLSISDASTNLTRQIITASGVEEHFKQIKKYYSPNIPIVNENTWHRMAISVSKTTISLYLDGIIILEIPKANKNKSLSSSLEKKEQISFNFGSWTENILIGAAPSNIDVLNSQDELSQFIPSIFNIKTVQIRASHINLLELKMIGACRTELGEWNYLDTGLSSTDRACLQQIMQEMGYTSSWSYNALLRSYYDLRMACDFVRSENGQKELNRVDSIADTILTKHIMLVAGFPMIGDDAFLSANDGSILQKTVVSLLKQSVQESSLTAISSYRLKCKGSRSREKPVKLHASFRVLENTDKQYHEALSDIDNQDEANLVFDDSKELINWDAVTIAKTLAVSQQALNSLECRDCFIRILKHASANITNSKELLELMQSFESGNSVLVRFIRLSHYFNDSKHMELLSQVVLDILQVEFKQLSKAMNNSYDTSVEYVQLHCPVSFSLMCEALFHLLFMLKKSHSSGRHEYTIESENEALDLENNPDPILSLWILDVFVKFLRNQSKEDTYILMLMMQHVLFLRPVVNLVLEMISMDHLNKKTRLAFLHLVTFLSEMDSQQKKRDESKTEHNNVYLFSLVQIANLKVLLDDMYVNLGGTEILGKSTFLASSFFQALTQFNVSVDLKFNTRNKITSSSVSDWFGVVMDIYQLVRSLGPIRNDNKNQAPEWFWEEAYVSWKSYSEEKRTETLSEFIDINKKFTFKSDCEVVLLVRRYYEKNNISSISVIKDFEMVSQFQTLEEMSQRALVMRICTLSYMFSMVKMLIPFVDLCLPIGYSKLCDDLRAIRPLFFWSNKKKIYDSAMNATVDTKHVVTAISVDRFKAIRMKQKGKCDVDGKKSIFGQLFRNCREMDIWRVTRSARAIKVHFAGEHSTDVGGPYRQMISDMCDELQSSQLPLFIPCPNNRAKVGMNQEKWVPVPTAHRPVHIQMYEFVGKMMGLAMRSGDFLNLDFPSIVWKYLVNNADGITKDDVLAIDILSYKILDLMDSIRRSADDENMDDLKLQFEEMDTRFEIVASDQKVHELIENGSEIRVTWENQDEFVSLAKSFRLNEFKTQCEAMRRGLATVVPFGILSLFTATELELEVCGRLSVDVDLLERYTDYDSNLSSQDQHIQMFWTMMRERFDDQERAMFLRFVWGRSRLPLPGDVWERKFKISKHTKSLSNAHRVNEYLPDAHTCFFTLDLPKYTNPEAMYKKVLYAITHCIAVDGDVSLNRGGIDLDASDSDDEL